MAEFLDKTGVETVWGKVKELLSDKVDNSTFQDFTNTVGEANGLATLDATGSIPEAQLPTFKTVNGNSILGSGNISIDLSIFMLVDELPAKGVENKVYLVTSPSWKPENVYTEYIWVNNSWETLGEYTASVDLTPYLKKTDLATTTKDGAMSASDKAKLDGIAAGANKYTLPTASSSTLGGIKVGSGLSINNGVLSANVTSIPTIEDATTTKSGLMSASDKQKLNSIATNATADKAIDTETLKSLLV